MLEEGKCYYNDKLIVKIIHEQINNYHVRGISIPNKIYYHDAFMRKDVQLIPLVEYKFNEIINKIRSNYGHLTPKVLDLINELIFEI